MVKRTLAIAVTNFFIKGKPTVINILIKFPPSRLVLFIVVPFNKIKLFYKYLIPFIISFTALIVRVILEPVTYSLLNQPICLSRKSFPPGCIILSNWAFKNFMLADEPFAKALRIFETCVSLNDNLCGKSVSSLEFLIEFDEFFFYYRF